MDGNLANHPLDGSLDGGYTLQPMRSIAQGARGTVTIGALSLAEARRSALPLFLTPQDVADVLRCSRAHAYDVIQKNGLAAPLAGTKIVRVSRDRLLAYLGEA
jgi:excisionase family DNA binding protein